MSFAKVVNSLITVNINKIRREGYKEPTQEPRLPSAFSNVCGPPPPYEQHSDIRKLLERVYGTGEPMPFYDSLRVNELTIKMLSRHNESVNDKSPIRVYFIPVLRDNIAKVETHGCLIDNALAKLAKADFLFEITGATADKVYCVQYTINGVKGSSFLLNSSRIVLTKLSAEDKHGFSVALSSDKITNMTDVSTTNAPNSVCIVITVQTCVKIQKKPTAPPPDSDDDVECDCICTSEGPELVARGRNVVATSKNVKMYNKSPSSQKFVDNHEYRATDVIRTITLVLGITNE